MQVLEFSEAPRMSLNTMPSTDEITDGLLRKSPVIMTTKKTKQNKQKDSSQSLSLFFNFTFVRKMNQLTNSTPYIYCAFISSKQPRKHIFLQEHLAKMGISCEQRQLKGKIKFVSTSYVKSHINPTSHKSTQQALFYTSKCKIIQLLSAASTAKNATNQCYLGIHQRRKAPGKKWSMHRSEQK